MTKRALVIGINHYPGIPGRDLRGAVNDANVLERLLRDRFDFVVRALRDGQATRAGILEAWRQLIAETRADDQVVVTYAGHGSRLTLDDGTTRESLVPHDSGRDAHPNRDILDLEVDDLVRALEEKTHRVALIFDCCHSGSVYRDAFGDATREVPSDHRLPEGYAHLTSRSVQAGPSGWPGARSTSVLAACNASELAYELRSGGVHHGAFTFHLAAELTRAGDRTTWRDVFEVVANRVTADRDLQHPQLEGERNVVVFAGSLEPPRPYTLVTRADDAGLTLAGGAAHGLSVGSQLAVYAPGTSAPTGTALARVEVQSLTALEAKATYLDPRSSAPVPPSARAFLQRLRVPGGLAVFVEGTQPSAGLVRDALGSPLLLASRTEDQAEVLVRLLPPRDAEAAVHAPCPQVGALREAMWAAVGRDGRLLARLQPDVAGSPGRLAADLEKFARVRSLRALDNPRSSIAGLVELGVLRGEGPGGPLVALRAEDVSIPGDRFEFELVNRAQRQLFVTVLQIGVDGRVGFVLPARVGPSEPLAPDRPLRIAAEHLKAPAGVSFKLPEGFPYAAEHGGRADEGAMVVKVLVTTRPADFHGLVQDAHRAVDPTAGPRSGLADLQRFVRAWTGDSPREETTRFLEISPPDSDDDWAVVTCALRVTRTRPAVSAARTALMVEGARSVVAGARGVDDDAAKFQKTLPEFFRMVARGLVDAQGALDDQAAVYNRNRKEHRKQFVIPSLTAKVAANFSEQGESGLSLIFLKNTELSSNTRSQEVQFTIETVPAQPERGATDPTDRGPGFQPTGVGTGGPPWQGAGAQSGLGHLRLDELKDSPDPETRRLSEELRSHAAPTPVCLSLGSDVWLVRLQRRDQRVDVYAVTTGGKPDARRITRIRAPEA